MLRWGLAGIAFAGFAFSAYLTGTQAFLIGSYCVYCLTSASLMTAIMALTLVAAVSGQLTAISRQLSGVLRQAQDERIESDGMD